MVIVELPTCLSNLVPCVRHQLGPEEGFIGKDSLFKRTPNPRM